jgi:uncharacterized protein (TIRG00374 family)
MNDSGPITGGTTSRETPTGGVQSKGGWLRKHWMWLLAVSILLSLAVPFFLGGLKQFETLRKLSWWAAILLAALVLVSWAFNALRARMLLGALGERISFFDAALVIISAEFAGVATPASVGMPATYTFLFHNHGVTIGEALGLVGAITLLDIMYFGSIMSLAVVIQVLRGTGVSMKIAGVILVVIAGGVLVILLLIKNFRRVYHFVSRQMAHVSWLAERRMSLARGTVHFLQAVRTLRQLSWLKLASLYLVTVGFWLPRYLLLIFIMYLVGAEIPFSYLLLVQGVLNLGGQMFLMPGGGGVVDASFAAFLSPYLAREPLAFTLLVWRTYSFYWYLIVGGPIFLYKTGDAARNLLTRK